MSETSPDPTKDALFQKRSLHSGASDEEPLPKRAKLESPTGHPPPAPRSPESSACPAPGDAAWNLLSHPDAEQTVAKLGELCKHLGVPEDSVTDFLKLIALGMKACRTSVSAPSSLDLWEKIKQFCFLRWGNASPSPYSIICQYVLPPPPKREPWENPCLEQQDDIQNWMRTCLERVAELWSGNKLCAPYFALIQSSGSGKTTCMKQIALMYPSLYIDCSKDEELQSDLAEICALSTEAEACSQMVALLDRLFARCSENPPDPNLKCSRVLLLDEARLWIETPAKYKLSSTHAPNTDRHALHLLRKALRARYNPKNTKGDVVVLADTVSRVANFVPTLESQPTSLRARHSHASVALFPAVTHFPSVNVHPQSEGGNFMTFSNLCKIGRPLWYSLLLQQLSNSASKEGGDLATLKRTLDTQEHQWMTAQNMSPQWEQAYLKAVEEVLMVAQVKLLRNLRVRKEAILGSRLSIHGFHKHTTTDLIALSLAYCTHVSENREVIRCDFVPEPVVSEGALLYMYGGKAQSSLSLSLEYLQQALRDQTVDVGRLGEVISQTILLGAYDQCVKDLCPNRSDYLVRAASYPITLKSFLSKMLPQAHLELLSQEAGLFTHPLVGPGEQTEEYCVFFNHFALLTEPLSRDILAQGLRSASAFQNAENTPGSDLTIPLYGRRTQKLLGALHVQVKTSASESPAQRTESMVQKLQWGMVCANDENALADLAPLRFFGLHLSLRAKRGDGNQPLNQPLLMRSSEEVGAKHPDIFIRSEPEVAQPRISPPRYPASNVVLFLGEGPWAGDVLEDIQHLLDFHSSVAHYGYTALGPDNRNKCLSRNARFPGESPTKTMERFNA